MQRDRVIVNRRSWAICVTTEKDETNPYCPAARAMPSDDIPFIVESDEEFPPGTEKPVRVRLCAWAILMEGICRISHENAINEVEHLH